MSRILLLEDDLSLIDGLAFTFRKQDHEAGVAKTLDEAEKIQSDGKYDLLVLDVSLPDGSGLDFCKMVQQTSKVPITFLTASDEEINIIMKLDVDGDDHVTKPFKLGVLILRINVLFRRVEDLDTADTELQSNGIRVLLLQGQVYKSGEYLELTATKYKLLCFFMQDPNMVLSEEKILDELWDCEGNYIDNNTLTVYIRRLRMKVESNPGEPQMIVTARRMDYEWNVVR